MGATCGPCRAGDRVRRAELNRRLVSVFRTALTLFVASWLVGCTQEQPPTERPQRTARAEQETVSGEAMAIDGDAIAIGGRVFWLDGIDAPAAGKMCGDIDVHQQATAALSALIDGKTVVCFPVGRVDPEGRQGARCQFEGVNDLSERMVDLGMARDWPEYSVGRYRNGELMLRRYKRGIWSESCPSDLWPDDRDYTMSRAFRGLHEGN